MKHISLDEGDPMWVHADIEDSSELTAKLWREAASEEDGDN